MRRIGDRIDDLALKRAKGVTLKNAYIIMLGERALKSKHPEYYQQALRLVKDIHPARLRICLLTCRYSTEQIADMLDLAPKYIVKVKSETMAMIRKNVDSDSYNSSSVIQYFLGMVDIDMYTLVVESL